MKILRRNPIKQLKVLMSLITVLFSILQPSPISAQAEKSIKVSSGNPISSDLRVIALPATTWYVNATGNDTNNCISPATACRTISAAISRAATSGDTIKVASGIYTGSGTEVLKIDKGIVLSGGWDESFINQNGMSTIDGQGTRNGILINDLGYVVTIERLVIKNSGENNYGMINRGTTILDEVHAYKNGRALINRGVMTINNSSFTNNGSLGTCGGAIMNLEYLATLVINNSTISNNSSSLTDCYPFSGGTSGLLNSGGRITLNNTTIADNINGGIWSSYPANSTTLQNSLVTGNKLESGESADCYAGDVLNSLGYNIFSVAQCTLNSADGDQIGTMNLPIDSLTGALIGSPAYRPLKIGSPAIDGGNPGGCTGNTGILNSDQRGVSRVGRCDIGAYEYTVGSLAVSLSVAGGDDQRGAAGFAFPHPFQAAALDIQGSPVGGVPITFTAPVSGASGTFTDTGTNTTTVITNADGIATTAAFTANNQGGVYVVSASAIDLGSVDFNLQNIDWLVAPNGNDNNSCDTTIAPCLTINGAISKAAAGDTIRVASGMYVGVETEVAHISKSVTLSGGWNTNFLAQTGYSIIDGQSARMGAVIDNSAHVTIDRFRIQNGSSCSAGGIHVWGGDTTLVLTNSIITNNKTTCVGGAAGGILNYGYTTITNSTISNNTGSGINSSGGTFTLNTSTVSGNIVSGGSGGGIKNGSLAFINNSTISGNIINNNNGAGIYNTGTITFNNSTITNNNAVNGSGGGIWNWEYGGAVVIMNTIVATNFSGTGILFSPDCGGIITSSGYNLLGNNAGCSFTPTVGDIVGTISSPIYAGLDILQNNGGPTFTHALLDGSPAIDAGNPATPSSGGNACLETDQRNNSRTKGRCDIGAYETTIFADVLSTYWASSFIERLYGAGVTGGCSSHPLRYCPDTYVTRAQMAVFILRAKHGRTFTPSSPSGEIFRDVPADYWAAAWIEELAKEGITGGCGNDKYCPETIVTRDQMAVFLLRGVYGNNYTPPDSTGTMFGDVPVDYWAASWIEQLSAEGITSGCGNGNYCPNTYVTRAQMAVFLVKAFNLP